MSTKEEMFSLNHLFFQSCIIPKLFFSILGEIFKTITLINNHEYPYLEVEVYGTY